MIKVTKLGTVIGMALLSTALMASMCSGDRAPRRTSTAICDKFGISSIAGAMGRTSVIVVVQPTGAAHDATSSSGAHLRQATVHADRYLFGSGPQEFTVSQADKCGSSQDPDYVELKKGKTYVLFLELSASLGQPYAVPIGFSVDKSGSLNSLKSSDPAFAYYNPQRWGIKTLDDIATKVSYYSANTPTPYPTVPMPSDILKPGLQLNLAQVLNLDKGFTFKDPTRGKGGIVNDPALLSRLKAALNTTLTLEPASAPPSLETLGSRPIVIFTLATPVYGVDYVGADYDSADGLLLNIETAPVQLRLPPAARDIINEALNEAR